MAKKPRFKRNPRFPIERVAIEMKCDAWWHDPVQRAAAEKMDGEPTKTCWRCKGKGVYYRHEQAWLCIGGPLNGTMIHYTGLKERDLLGEYEPYNRGSKDPAIPSALWISTTLIPTP